jgi:hypothetical protein
VLPFTNDPNQFRTAVNNLKNQITKATEAGTEAITLTLTPQDPNNPMIGLTDPDDLEFRPNAFRNLILYTDEDDDAPSLFDNGEPRLGRKREPPGRGIACYDTLRCEDRWLDFQNRLDEAATLLIVKQVQLNMVLNPRNPPSKQQYGDPACTVTDAEGRLDPQLTLECLFTRRRGAPKSAEGICKAGWCSQGRVGQPCSIDPDCNAFGLQHHLLSSGACGGGGVCIGGRIGSPCVDDFNCAVLARAYKIPKSLEDATQFFEQEFIPDKIREQVCR